MASLKKLLWHIVLLFMLLFSFNIVAVSSASGGVKPPGGNGENEPNVKGGRTGGERRGSKISLKLMFSIPLVCIWEIRSPGCFPITTSNAKTPKLNTSHFSVTALVYASSACRIQCNLEELNMPISGTLPSKLLYERLMLDKLCISPMESGIEPDRLLKSCKDARFPIWYGMVPFKSLILKFKLNKFEQSPISIGTGPLKVFPERSKDCKFESFPIPSGIEPERLLLLKIISGKVKVLEFSEESNVLWDGACEVVFFEIKSEKVWESREVQVLKSTLKTSVSQISVAFSWHPNRTLCPLNSYDLCVVDFAWNRAPFFEYFLCDVDAIFKHFGH
ncbi:hypothetical protein G2W53_011201 [Senna tora]|uniref:Uncharacterized protein n=1 Tax=Senna tora TaxID=362788 RepID=A0A835CEY6_9FABA|nr:hypothetical protein G2W53_011201 [Senna tora]